jgi:hypothetical protein
MKTWKVQKLFGDVIYDLRSRGLLPVVILLLVAMVAVPVLISRGGSDSSTPSLQTAAAVPSTPENETAVVSYSPSGVRDYRRRLDDLSPKNPFRRQFDEAAASASKLSVDNSAALATDSSGSGSADSATTKGGDTTSGGGTGSSGGTDGDKKKRKTSYTYSVTVMAGDVETTLTPFGHIAPMTPLPSQTTSVLVFYGLNGDNKRALFLVSNKVDGLTGPGTCVPAPDDCSLLSLAPGQSEDLHYSKDGHTYRVVVAEIKRTAK